MMTIDMTAQLGLLITSLQVITLIAASAVVASALRGRRPAAPSATSTPKPSRHLAIVGASPSAPAQSGAAPSDTSLPEAA